MHEPVEHLGRDAVRLSGVLVRYGVAAVDT